MAVVLSTCQSVGDKDIRGALHDITSSVHYPQDRKHECTVFNNAILGYIHQSGVFELGDMPCPDRAFSVTAYILPDGSKVMLRSIHNNFLVRVLYGVTQAPLLPFALFVHLKLSDIPIPDQVLCSAAAIKSTNDWGVEVGFSWFKILVDIGFPIVKNGQLIQDFQGNSIIDIVSDGHVRILLREIVRAKIPQVKVHAKTFTRISTLATSDKSIQKSLSGIMLIPL